MRCAKRGETVRTRIKNQQDFWAGLMFIGFGLVAVVIARDYPMGTAMRMGPGYFPTCLGALMVAIGTIVTATAFKFHGDAVGGWAWRPLIVLSGAFILFGTLMDHLGFVPSLAILILGAALAGREFRLLEVILMTVVLITAAVGIFIYGIELPFQLFWW
jgi:hypothetical protein